MDNLLEKVDFRIRAPHSIQECQQRLAGLEKGGMFALNKTRVTLTPENDDRIAVKIRRRIGRNYHVNLVGTLEAAGSQQTHFAGVVRPDWWIWIILAVYAVFMILMGVFAQIALFFVVLVVVYMINIFILVFMFQRQKQQLIALVREALNGEDELL